MAYREDYIVDGVLYYTKVCEGSVIQPFNWRMTPNKIDHNIYAHMIDGYPYIVGKDSIMLYETTNIQEDKEMTPCEKKGYKVGQVFEIANSCAGFNGAAGDVIVLQNDDGTGTPFFDVIKTVHESGRSVGDNICKTLSHIKRIYPPEEKKVETIELMGKTYDKAEIEKALSSVCAISD